MTYLPPLQFLNVNNSGILDGCHNCDSGPIYLEQQIPFGSHYHGEVYVRDFIKFPAKEINCSLLDLVSYFLL